MSKICPCPNPPGGQIVCEDNQFGMCGYQDGKRIGGCQNIPDAIALIKSRRERTLATVNWVLSQLTGENRSPGDEVGAEELEMLRSGSTTRGSLTVRFSLPASIDLDDVEGVKMTVAF